MSSLYRGWWSSIAWKITAKNEKILFIFIIYWSFFLSPIEIARLHCDRAFKLFWWKKKKKEISLYPVRMLIFPSSFHCRMRSISFSSVSTLDALCDRVYICSPPLDAQPTQTQPVKWSERMCTSSCCFVLFFFFFFFSPKITATTSFT